MCKSIFLNNVFRVCLFVLVSTCLSMSQLRAQTHRVTIDKKDITLNEFLSEVRKQTGYDFIFTSSKLDFSKRVSPKFNNATITQVLNTYFNTETGVIYILKNKTIVLIDEEKAEYRVLQGRVIDATNKQPMAGVTVSITEKNVHTRTDNSGNYIINIPEYAQVLEFTYLGYEKETIALTASIRYDVELQEKTERIEDVVVTGLFNRNMESFTGASKVISGDDLRQINVKSVFSALAAVDPSFRLVNNNAIGGDINQMTQIQLRGENSFPNLTGELSNNPTTPLFILDGFEVSQERVMDLDINLINSITILKDASATAMYGSRGANGILVITTIPPQSGKLRFSFNNDFSLTTPQLSVYNMLDAKDKLDFETRAGLYTSTTATTQYQRDVLRNERYKQYLQGNNTDWLSLPVQTGYSNRSSLRAEGGDDSFRYGLQFTADLQEGVMKGQDRNNYSGQVDLMYNVNSFRFSNSLRVLSNQSNNSPYGSFSEYVSANPYYSPYDEQGQLKQYLEYLQIDNSLYTKDNPMYDTKFNSIDKSGYFGVTNNFSARYTVRPNLFVESSLSVTKRTDRSDQFFSALDSRFADVRDLNQRGSYTVRSGNNLAYESTTTANYNVSKGKNILFSTLAFNIASDNSDNYRLVAEGFPSDQLDNLLFASQYQTNGRPTGDESTVNRLGLVLSGNYSYDNRFLADLSFRRDGSSQYGTDKRFGNFWAAGIGWNLHNEKFIADLGFVDRLKLRSSYGVTGSLNIPAYSSQYRYSYNTSTSYYGELGAILSNMGNPLLSWQSVYKLNVGADISLLKDNLTLTLDAYRENTKNAVTSVSLAPSTGFTSYSENLGELQNIGYEFSARYVLTRDVTKGLLWAIHVNGFTNDNILKKLSNRLASINDQLDAANAEQTIPNILLREGESVNSIYAVRSLGVDPATGAEVFLTKEGALTFDWNARDKVAVGINQPKWNGNFGTNFAYRGFDFNVIFNYQFGGQLYNQTLINRVESVNPSDNVDRRAYELGWAYPGDLSQFTRISTSSAPTKATSRFVQDERNLRLTSASLGYNFMYTDWIKRAKIRSLQVNLSTNDLLWLSSIQIERGTDNPFYRNYALSVRVGF